MSAPALAAAPSPAAVLRASIARAAGSTLARNTAWSAAGALCRAAIQLGYFLLIARALGPAGYGAFAAAVALVSVAAPFAGWGSGNLLVRRVALEPARFPAAWGNALVAIAVSGALLAALATGTAAALLAGSVPIALVALVAVSDLLLVPVVDTAGRAYEGLQRLGRTAQLQVAISVCRLSAAAALVLAIKEPTALAWGAGYAASSAAAALVALAVVRRELGPARPEPATLRAELRDGFHFSAGHATYAVYNDADKVLLARLSTLSAAGLYGLAYRAVDVAMIPVMAVLRASHARFFRSGAAGVGGSLALARSLVPWLAAYAALAGAALFAGAPAVVRLVGDGYAGAAEVLRWLAVLPLLKALQYVGGDTLTGAGRQGLLTAIQAGVAGANVVLNLWMIPTWGWSGAAAATLLTDSALVLGTWLAVARLRRCEIASVAAASARADETSAADAMRYGAAGPVSICIATCRRPEGLRRLLLALDALTFARGPAPEVELVVADNDAEGSALAVCAELAPRLRWPLRYVREPRRGISFARNRALAAARADAAWIAILDDDEEPEPRWLDELLAVQAAHGADVVAGPVLPRFEQPVSPWVVRGRFFEVARHATGTRLDCADTGNVLVRAPVFRAAPEPFDPRLALSGGEDTLFFLRAARAGHRIVWADDAVAHEWVPPGRVRLAWLLRRAFRRGNTWAFCEREMDPSLRRRLLRLARGMAWMATGAVLLPLSVVRGRHQAVAALRRMWTGAGNLAALAGLRFQEYGG